MKLKNIVAGMGMALAMTLAIPSANAFTIANCGDVFSIGFSGAETVFSGLVTAAGGPGSCTVEFDSLASTPGLAEATINANTLNFGFSNLIMSWWSIATSSVISTTPIGVGSTSLATLFIYPSDADQLLIFEWDGSVKGAGFDYTVDISPVPLPPAALLLVSGLLGIGALSRRQRRKVEAA